MKFARPSGRLREDRRSIGEARQHEIEVKNEVNRAQQILWHVKARFEAQQKQKRW